MICVYFMYRIVCRLIKKCYPQVKGLQDVSLGQTLAFDVECRGGFVQILHTGKGHWLTISTVDCDADGDECKAYVDVFDSMPPAITTSLENQIAALICTKKAAIVLR